MIYLYMFLYFTYGFILCSLAHRYFQEMNSFQFLVFIIVWPMIFIFICLYFISLIFEKYLKFIGEKK